MRMIQNLIGKWTKPGATLAASCIAAALLCGPVAAQSLATSVDPFELKADRQTTLGLYLTASEAHGHLTKRPEILLLDARSRAEVNFLGLADAADANIPYGLLHPGFLLGEDGKSYNKVKNKFFVEAVKELIARKGLKHDPVIFVMCRDSHGVARIVNDLAGQGFTQVYAIVDGFEGDLGKTGRRSVNGWKNAGLPWSYGIGTERAYRLPMEAIEEKLSN